VERWPSVQMRTKSAIVQKYSISLSEIMAQELTEAVKDCATSRGGMTITANEYIRECVESTLASRRIERLAAKQ